MKRLLLSFLLISFAGFLFAEKVELKEAKTIAKNAYFQKLNTYNNPVGFDALQIADQFTIKNNGEEMIYVFDFTGYGFILIAADDAIEPVLGYTFDNQYPLENQPEGFHGVLAEFKEQIQYLRDNNIEASNKIEAQWNALLSFDPSQFTPQKGDKDIDPLVTCTWNQDSPYNFLCPEDPQGPGGHVYVGCVATAMSQIMYYWRFPLQGQHSHSYNASGYGTQSANFEETTYPWDEMVDNTDSKYNLAIALIGYHAGVSVDMMYSAGGSGAYSDDVPFALKYYFKYSNSCVYKQRTNYNLTTWKNMVQSELDDDCPVYYSGSSPDGGHAFVLDGRHDADDTYHFNFGWSGSGNGWYLITNAGGFPSNQGMVINIVPNDDNYPYGCGMNSEKTSLVGSFEDGSGPMENYDENADCSWLINPQTATDSVTYIKIEFTKFDTDPNDIVTVYDGPTTDDPVLGTYSGTTIPAIISSTGNQVLVTFVADGNSTTSAGWQLEYESVLPSYCGSLVTLEDPTGTISDGSGDFYYNNQSNCMWKIAPVYASDLTLTFTEFNTDIEDVLKIYDATNNQLLAEISGEYTSGNMPDPVFTENGQVFLIFQSDGIYNAPGWSADWEIGNVSVKEQMDGVSMLNVFPNPANNILNISFKTDRVQSFTVKLMSVTGEVVYEDTSDNFSGNYSNSIDVSSFAKGVYILNLSNETGSVNKKVVIR